MNTDKEIIASPTLQQSFKRRSRDIKRESIAETTPATPATPAAPVAPAAPSTITITIIDRYANLTPFEKFKCSSIGTMIVMIFLISNFGIETMLLAGILVTIYNFNN